MFLNDVNIYDKYLRYLSFCCLQCWAGVAGAGKFKPVGRRCFRECCRDTVRICATPPMWSLVSSLVVPVLPFAGGFEELGTLVRQLWNPADVIKKLQADHNIDVFFKISVVADPDNSSSNIIQVGWGERVNRLHQRPRMPPWASRLLTSKTVVGAPLSPNKQTNRQ